jgi:hypothetical protein
LTFRWLRETPRLLPTDSYASRPLCFGVALQQRLIWVQLVFACLLRNHNLWQKQGNADPQIEKKLVGARMSGLDLGAR